MGKTNPSLGLVYWCPQSNKTCASFTGCFNTHRFLHEPLPWSNREISPGYLPLSIDTATLPRSPGLVPLFFHLYLMIMPINRTHINESIREVDSDSWLIAGKLLLSRQPSPSAEKPSWSDGKGRFFVLSDAPDPLPESKSLAQDSAALPMVHAAGDQSAVWRAGEAFVKVHDILWPDATREHVTLAFLKAKGPLDFDFPEVIYNGEFDKRYYLILTSVPGRTLSEEWPEMDEAMRQRYVWRVADICAKLAKWKGNTICGVDGRQLLEVYLSEGDSTDMLAPEQLRKNCLQMSMDVSSLVFCHLDLGPCNLIVDPAKDSIGIIDWELAGYVPREWVKTKFNLSSGMDFPTADASERSGWRRLVATRLAEIGFTDAIDGWLSFRSG